MERGKLTSSGRGGKSKAPQHPQDIFALGTKNPVVVPRDSEKRTIHKPSTSGVDRKREPASFGAPPPGKRTRIGSPAESVSGASLEIDPVDLVPQVLQALDTHNSDKLLGLLTGSIRLLKSQRSKPDPVLCMSMLYLTKIRPNMFAHDTVTQSLCGLLKREQGTAFKSKGNPLVFVLACNMLYAGHKDNDNWPDVFIKVYIEDALNERWWVDCSWCKCLVENIVTAFNTKQPPAHLIPNENTLGTMSPSGAGSPLMGSNEEESDSGELEYKVYPRYSGSYEAVEGLVLEAIKEQIQRRAAPDAIGKGFLKLLCATCGFPEIRMIAASRLEGWLHSGKLWRSAIELLAWVTRNAALCPTPRDHEVLAQLARMRLKTKPLANAYIACLKEMVADSPALLRSVVTHTIYNELSNVRSPNNLAVLAALVQAQPTAVPSAIADTYQELLLRPEDYLRPLRAFTREVLRACRLECVVPLARALARSSIAEGVEATIRERAFLSLVDLMTLLCLVVGVTKGAGQEHRTVVAAVQAEATGWLLDEAHLYKPSAHEYRTALHKIMFVEPAESYTKVDNWPSEAERTAAHRLCCEAPLPQNTLLRIIFIGLSKEIPISCAETFELVEQLVRRACALPPEDNPLQVDKLQIVEYMFQLCQFHPPDNITLPSGYTPPSLAITSLYWRAWLILVMVAAHNPEDFALRAYSTYPTLRALIECCITSKPSLEWTDSTPTEVEAEKAAILQLESHLAAASNSKLPVTEQNCRLPSQLSVLSVEGPARRPPSSVSDSLWSLSSSLRLGRLLARQPALLSQLAQSHGTRRALPWLHKLLQQEKLQLSALPVQCLCEFATAKGGSSVALHLRSQLSQLPQVVLHYAKRLAHPLGCTRDAAQRGLKLVLGDSEEITDADYNSEVGPDEWLPQLWSFPHLMGMQEELVLRLRAASQVECHPQHVAHYLIFLDRFYHENPNLDHVPMLLDLSQLLMERPTIMNCILPPTDPDVQTNCDLSHRTLYALTNTFYSYMQKMRASAGSPEEVVSSWSCVSLQWQIGREANVPALIAHAMIKMLCHGPSKLDTNHTMYNWLVQTWLGPESAVLSPSAVLPEWLRIHLVRSSRQPHVDEALRGLTAHQLTLFIQTFGMPVKAMTAMLRCLDSCPMSSVVSSCGEPSFVLQLLKVQKQRGALGGDAFAAQLLQHQHQYPPEEEIYTPEPLPEEMEEAWYSSTILDKIQAEHIGALLSTVFLNANMYHLDVDMAFTQLQMEMCSEINFAHRPYTEAVIGFLRTALCSKQQQLASSLLIKASHAGPLLRALIPHARKNDARVLREISDILLRLYKVTISPVVGLLRELFEASSSSKAKGSDMDGPDIKPGTNRDKLVAILEAATPSSIEQIGTKIIETQDTAIVVDVITNILQKSQDGAYDVPIKSESGVNENGPLLSSRGLGQGLMLDWLCDLQQETLGPYPEKQMKLMFSRVDVPWRPLLSTSLAHRASWKTLHKCLKTLLNDHTKWQPSTVLDFAETLTRSPRLWEGRDRSTPKHHTPENVLRLDNDQLQSLVRLCISENNHNPSRRLPLLLRCCEHDEQLLSAALAAYDLTMTDGQNKHSASQLLLALYMQVPKISRLLKQCGASVEMPSPSEELSRTGLSICDSISHTLLTALASHTDQQKMSWCAMGVLSVWGPPWWVGGRGLALVHALSSGGGNQALRTLQAIHAMPDETLFHHEYTKELEAILECYLSMAAGGSSRDSSFLHKAASLLRRYLAHSPHRAKPLLHKWRDTIASVGALSSLSSYGTEVPTPGSALPPPNALLAIQRQNVPPEQLCSDLQEIEQWCSRRGFAGSSPAALVRALPPLIASPYRNVRAQAITTLTKLTTAHTTHSDTVLQAILECLESNQPEVIQSILDKLSEIVSCMQKHAVVILMKVFEIGMKGGYPVEGPITKTLNNINLLKGC